MTKLRALLRALTLSAACAALAAAASPSRVEAKGGAYRESAHGKRDRGVYRIPGVRRGECAQCHGSRRDANGRGERRDHSGLFAPNDNTLCFACHTGPSGTYLGEQQYFNSSHGRSLDAVWPGPSPAGRPPRDAGKCVNCHDPHGVKDSAGLVPDLLRVRGAAQCLGCHGGNPATDIAAAIARTYRHPLIADATAGSAQPSGGPVPPASTGTCSACHNPHVSAADPVRPRAPESARALLGVARVRVASGAAGTAPLHSPVPATDTTAVREYEICFKCHSASAAQPARSANVAAAFNPNNASFHPMQDLGRNANIDRRAFVEGWTADRLVTCSDCHSSDDDLARGPHGSSYPHILKKRYVAGAARQPMAETDLCFECHSFETYGDPQGVATGYSRFAGHASHVGKGYSCWACHDAHGSATFPALIAMRSPGFSAYSQTPAGGTCTVSCHLTTPSTTMYGGAYPR